jgi:hypothetical protein
MIFCTLFNWLFLPQGIALYRSLARTTKGKFVLYVLCMDDYVLGALRSLNLPNLRPMGLSEIENDALRAVRGKRTIGEYCWTCTTPLLLRVIAEQPQDAVVTYVDADLRFFSDPSVVLAEMGKGSIYVHEHDFAQEHGHLQMVSGRFNVGLVAFRNNEEGRTCLEKWSAQCLEQCVMDPAAGLCGDQGYMDEWPGLYAGLVISKNPGVGLAPWNISKYRVANHQRRVTVDGKSVVFYHYHSMRMMRPRLGFKPIATTKGNYRFEQSVINAIYAPYAREVWQASRQLDRKRHNITKAIPTIPHVYAETRNDQLMFQIGGYSFPVKSNVWLLKALYGIDADREML